MWFRFGLGGPVCSSNALGERALSSGFQASRGTFSSRLPFRSWIGSGPSASFSFFILMCEWGNQSRVPANHNNGQIELHTYAFGGSISRWAPSLHSETQFVKKRKNKCWVSIKYSLHLRWNLFNNE